MDGTTAGLVEVAVVHHLHRVDIALEHERIHLHTLGDAGRAVHDFTAAFDVARHRRSLGDHQWFPPASWVSSASRRAALDVGDVGVSRPDRAERGKLEEARPLRPRHRHRRLPFGNGEVCCTETGVEPTAKPVQLGQMESLGVPLAVVDALAGGSERGRQIARGLEGQRQAMLVVADEERRAGAAPPAMPSVISCTPVATSPSIAVAMPRCGTAAPSQTRKPYSSAMAIAACACAAVAV